MIRDRILEGHRDCIYGLCPHENQHQLFSGGGDGYIVQWDAHASAPGTLVARVDSSVYSLATIPGHLLAGTRKGELYGFDLNTKQLAFRHQLEGSIFSIVAESGWLWAGTASGALFRLDADGQKVRNRYTVAPKSIRNLVLLQYNRFAAACSDGYVRLLEYSSASEHLETVHAWPAHAYSTFALAHMHDSNMLVTGGRDAQIRIWDVGQGGAEEIPLIQEVPAHWFTVNALWIDEDHKTLYSGSRDNTLKSWSLPELRLLERKGSKDRSTDDGHKHSINRLIWLEGAQRLVTASDDKRLMVWRLEDDHDHDMAGNAQHA